MRIRLISDNIDTLVGFRLVGVRGVVVHQKEEVQAALKEVIRDNEIGMLLVTHKLLEEFGELFQEVQNGRVGPIVVEIPDRHGMGKRGEFLLETIRESMGVKI